MTYLLCALHWCSRALVTLMENNKPLSLYTYAHKQTINKKTDYQRNVFTPKLPKRCGKRAGCGEGSLPGVILEDLSERVSLS